MENQAAEEEVDLNPAQVLASGGCVLTEALWSLVRREAQLTDQSDSYVIREILGAHFGLDRALVQPPRGRRGRRKKA